MLLYKSKYPYPYEIKSVEDNEDIVFYLIDGWCKLNDDIILSYDYAYKQRKRIPELEPCIMKDPKSAYYYARDLIKERWIDAEPFIMKDEFYTYMYAKDIIKGRWIAAEEVIIKDPQYAYMYARYVIKGRWIEAEEVIIQAPYYLDRYKEFSNTVKGVSA
jgi:hypothetical protein